MIPKPLLAAVLIAASGAIAPPAVAQSCLDQVKQLADKHGVSDVTPKDKAPDRTALQAALMAARAQAERGNEEGCLEALAKAKSLSAREG